MTKTYPAEIRQELETLFQNRVKHLKELKRLPIVKRPIVIEADSGDALVKVDFTGTGYSVWQFGEDVKLGHAVKFKSVADAQKQADFMTLKAKDKGLDTEYVVSNWKVAVELQLKNALRVLKEIQNA